MKGTFLRLCTVVCAAGLLSGAAQAQTPAAPGPGVDLVSANAFTPSPLPAAVQVEQDVLYFPAGVCSGFHAHGGPGIETVLSGEIVVETKATTTTPASTRTVKTGEAYTFPAGIVHNVCNMTHRPATFTSALLLLDGAPPVTPAK
ncbi:cupin domain-containing protein [Deinococcus radiomollis]|uniref:cupin domain-containing protein n=1 Tax=Deinococcus radiomollis TaxID=468916 RepID=UPI00389196A6